MYYSIFGLVITLTVDESYIKSKNSHLQLWMTAFYATFTFKILKLFMQFDMKFTIINKSELVLQTSIHIYALVSPTNAHEIGHPIAIIFQIDTSLNML